MPTAKNIFFCCLISCLFMMSGFSALAQTAGDDEQVKTEADRLFAQQKYGDAFPLYSQLLSIHRKDPYYSYRFGVCLLYTDRRDPEEPLKYMEPAVGNLTGEDAYMIYFHLGVAYHQAYRFGEALRAFEAFKGKVPVKSPYAKEAMIRNQMCNNGISLLQNLSDLVVMKKYEVNMDNFFRSYDISKFGGRIGPKPDFLKSKPDRASGEPELIFISDTHNVVYYSSYGKKNVTGRDIYRVYKLPGGKFSAPEKLSDAVNTPYDENYPYLLPDGRTLYFCSKGHNSMGGYDIFRTQYDTVKKDWATPVNVDFAINTPFDDILFITDPSQRYAWFSSLRNSSDGRIMVFLVRIDRKIPDYEDYNPQLIAAGNIDINSPEYLETIEKIRNKASLDVNSDEEIKIDTAKVVAANDNAKYNIPENPTGDQVVDIAFEHVSAAEDQLDNFRNMRDASLKISEQKKDQSAAFSKQSEDIYNKALTETDSKKRKEMIEQSNTLSKKSMLLSEESEVAKKMYDQYAVAADGQQKNLDRLQDMAGTVQKLALSRQIDTSVVMLKKLINEIDTFNINLVQLDKKIRGDNEYVADLESQISSNLADAKKLEDEAKKIDKEAEVYVNEAALATDPEMKKEYQEEADNLKAEADSMRLKSTQLKSDAKEKQNELVDLKSKPEQRNDIADLATAYVDSVNSANNNHDLADNNQNANNDNNNNQNTSDSGNQNNTDNNQNNNSDNNNQNATNDNNNQNVTDSGNQNNSNDNNQNNNQNNDVNNHQDTTHNNVVADNNHNNADNVNPVDTAKTTEPGNRKKIVEEQVRSGIEFRTDSVKTVAERTQQQMDAVNLAFSKKKSEYDFKLSQWTKLRDKSSLSQSEQMKKSELEADLTDLNLQMNVLSDYYDELKKQNDNIEIAQNNLSDLLLELNRNPEMDTVAMQKLSIRSGEVVSVVRPDTDSQQQLLAMRTNDLKTGIRETEKERNDAQSELKLLTRKVESLEAKLESTDNPKKRTQLETETATTREKETAMSERVQELNDRIISLNDSVAYLEKRHQLLGEVRNSYAQITDKELKSMSDSWNSTTEKSDISVVSNLPDFAVSNQQDVADNNNQNVSDNNNQNATDNNHQNDAGNNNADNNQNNSDNFNAQTTDKVVASDEEQDLIQSSFYEAGAQTFMVRIASLKKKLASHPADSNQIRSEIDALTRTMQAYNAEADAYRSNAENNLKLMNRQVPDHIPAYSEMSVIEFHQQQYELEMHKADSVRKLADASTDPAAKSRLQKQADDFEESAKRHYLMATDLYGVWNNSEYENNNVALTESNAARSQDSDNARMKMIEARQLRSEAYRERDFAKQREMLKLAQDKEKQALDLQQKVLAANNIDNPEKIVSRTVSEIETSTGNDIAEITKRYPLEKDILSNYEKSAVSNQDVTDNHQNDNNNNHDNNNNVVADNNHDVTDNHNVTDNQIDRDTVSSGQLPQDSSQLSVVSSQLPQDSGQLSVVSGQLPQDSSQWSVVSGQRSVASDTAKADNRLYYRIQISASRVEVDTTKYFKGMNVVVDKTGGWNQYMTGYFTSYNIANADLKRVRQQGYADAFVVAYYDGKRVPVYEARQREQGGTPALADRTGGTGNFSMNDVEGLVYSVQVGVYATTRNSNSLFGISPLIEERMTNGYYRYYAGTFNNMNDAVAARNKVRSGGVPDAFVVILYKGKKITQAEADRLLAEGTGFGGGLKQGGTGTQTQNTQVTPANTTPSSKPVFKVQIGAYSKDVPVTVVNTLIEIAGQGIETTKNDAGLTVYTVGSFSKYSEAEAKKNELNAKGLTDAFVVAFVDGKRVSVSEARKIVE